MANVQNMTRRYALRAPVLAGVAAALPAGALAASPALTPRERIDLAFAEIRQAMREISESGDEVAWLDAAIHLDRRRLQVSKETEPRVFREEREAEERAEREEFEVENQRSFDG
jgi:hypothetical protein